MTPTPYDHETSSGKKTIVSQHDDDEHNLVDDEAFEEIEVQSPDANKRDMIPAESAAAAGAASSSSRPSSGAAPAAAKPFCSRKCLIGTGIVLVAVLGVTVGLAFAFAPPGGPKQWFLHPKPPGLTEAQRWETGRYSGGLTLTVLNALDNSNYQSIFATWVSRWDSGSPDALTLTSERVDYDPDCVPDDGYLKVCNTNAGETGWRGINYIVSKGGYIANSVAIMNDFYLSTEGETWKDYTMCHEMGHGWGLPHTDENYYNGNTGDCLDLNTSPDGDVQPGTFNFDLLVKLYGTVDGTINATVMSNYTSSSGTNSFDGSGSSGRQRRQLEPLLRRGQQQDDSQSTTTTTTRASGYHGHRALIETRYLQATKAIGQGNLCGSTSKTGCSVDLGHGYTLHAHILPA